MPSVFPTSASSKTVLSELHENTLGHESGLLNHDMMYGSATLQANAASSNGHKDHTCHHNQYELVIANGLIHF